MNDPSNQPPGVIEGKVFVLVVLLLVNQGVQIILLVLHVIISRSVLFLGDPSCGEISE